MYIALPIKHSTILQCYYGR